jgi:hypothetical protein
MTATTGGQAAVGERVTVQLDGIPFTGTLLKAYAQPNHDIILAVQVEYYEVYGRRFAAEANEVPLRVSASTLVATSPATAEVR